MNHANAAATPLRYQELDRAEADAACALLDDPGPWERLSWADPGELAEVLAAVTPLVIARCRSGEHDSEACSPEEGGPRTPAEAAAGAAVIARCRASLLARLTGQRDPSPQNHDVVLGVV